MAQKLEDLINKDLLANYDDELKKTYLAGGIVFDISAHKATGNPATPATFAGLEAALGTNGANIPQNMRKGGMTVKFIKGSAQSQSNKYVQYRLKTQTFSTSVADWECIEDSVSAIEAAVGTGGSVDERIAAEGDKHYLKTETYTKTEVNGLVDTPHQEYVTVEHYADLPATGSADTIYRVSNWDGSADGGQGAVDVTMYSEYAWDGVSAPGRYVFLCVKSQIGEVFDISVYNNNTKYADLASALGTDGANVPESLRKGGMSVKYVQTYDNKYIQARCMAQNFTTNVAYWQDVDDEPTAGSKNLVESGGVVNYTENFVGNLIPGKAIDNTATIVNDSDWFVTRLIPVNVGDTVEYSSGYSDTPSTYSLVALAADGVTKVNYWRRGGSPRTITMPANTAYIRASFIKNSSYAFLTVNGVNKIIAGEVFDRLQPQIDSINTTLNNRGLQIELLLQKQAQLTQKQAQQTLSIGKLATEVNGTKVDNAAYDFIERKIIINNDYYLLASFNVKESDEVQYIGGFAGSGDNLGLAFFDSNSEIISYYSATYERSITVPANTAFVYATIKKETDGYLKINGESVDKDGLSETVLNLNNTVNTLKPVVNRLCEEVKTITEGNITDNKAQKTDGTIIDAEGFAIVEFSVSSGDVISYAGNFSGSSSSIYQNYGLVVYKTDGTVDNYYISTDYTRSITVSSNGAYVRATIKKDTNYVVKLNNENVINIGNIPSLEENVENINKELGKCVKREELLLPMNIFGDILPPSFKTKLEQFDTDILIAVQGDSLTGLIEYSGEQEEPQHCPPGQQYKSWLYWMQNYISKVKPMCDRLDSQRDNADFFTKTGTWENVVSIERTDIYAKDSTWYWEQRSMSALTFQCADTNASVSFAFDTDTYEKCNIVFSKEPDAVLTKIVIAEGDGKMLVSEDRSTWVEANGFTYNQRSPQGIFNSGNAIRQPQRRLWMKKATGVTGVINITYQRDNSISYEDSYMYVWGVERYSGIAIFVDNLGRGGKSTYLLKENISDIFDRHPDLAIYEMPLANEIGHSSTPVSMETLKGSDYYGGYFLSSEDYSYKERSNNYTTLPLIVVLPHGRSGYFDNNNNAVIWNNAPAGEPNAYECYKQMYGWLKGQLSSYSDVKFINLYDQIINEALFINDLINKGFYKEMGGENQITYDSIHLNAYGARLYGKYLIPIYQC